MAYGDQLSVRVRSTGDFRFENRLEEDVDEIGLVALGGIELSLDDLQDALEADTRGIPVRNFRGSQIHTDAGADGYALEFIVNVAADVAVLGIAGTAALIKGKLNDRRAAEGERFAAGLVAQDYDNAAADIIWRKFGFRRDLLSIDVVEQDVKGNGVVEATIIADNRKFRIELELIGEQLRLYRLRSIGGSIT